ncbi:MAG: OsmC family protein [Cyanobacteria bacterium J06621_3]
MAAQKKHLYRVTMQWTGNTGQGTASYREYERSHTIAAEGKPTILGSSDPSFRGDRTKYNPEELLVASLSSCHMLWYLHLCTTRNIVVLDYVDEPTGTMLETAEGSGQFAEVILSPVVTIQQGCSEAVAKSLHTEAHKYCFIANSVNFPVRCESSIQSA